MQNIILLHGALGSSKSFESFIPVLSNTFHTYTFDFRGHGIHSQDALISLEILSDQLISFIDQNQLAGSIIFGYSMGGYVAFISSIKRPELFGKIITLATKYHWNNSIAENEMYQLELILKLASDHPFKKQLIDMHGEKNYINCIKSTGFFMYELGMKNRLNLESLCKIKNKVLLLVGELDKMVTIEETLFVNEHLINSKLMIIPETKHPFEKVNLNNLTQIIRNFIEH